MTTLKRLATLATSLHAGVVSADLPRLEVLHTFDVPGDTAEIVACRTDLGLILSTNSAQQTIDIHRLTWAADFEPVLTSLDFDPQWIGAQGIAAAGKPTSVAVHPIEPRAYVAVLGASALDPGTLFEMSLQGDQLGEVTWRLPVGLHPDSLAVSPDGRWIVVANEAESNPATSGSVTVVDLALEPRVYELTGVGTSLGLQDGDVEPEYVAFDPRSRFAAVSLQENDAVIWIDLTGAIPVIGGVASLPEGADPDGLDVIDGVLGPEGRLGCLVLVAAEGRASQADQHIRLGNAMALLWVDPSDLSQSQMLSYTDLRPLIDADGPDTRRDPENGRLIRVGDRVLAVVAIERGDRLMLFDVTQPREPELLDIARVGDRPEGLAVIPHPNGNDLVLVTGDEGDDGPGTITLTRLVLGEPD